MKRWIIFGTIMFLLGYGIGSLRVLNDRLDTTPPVNVAFCFLLRNPDLIGARRFETQATITSISPHGSVLESNSCPEMAASFTEKLESHNHDAELNRKFQDNPYGSVSVLFEGTLYRPSLLRRMWFRTM